ncbi:MAG: alcohol dehydrogenase catalytic domain-containing protein [Gammaproteobacteria bacterium]
MGENIRAAVCREFGAPLSVETLALAPPAAREVRVKLAACAVCHSDIIQMDGGWGGALPAVFGHEAAGTVVETGSGADEFKPGDRVLATLMRSCGRCAFCESGAPSQCSAEFSADKKTRLADVQGRTIAAGFKIGAFAEQVVADCSQIAAIPDDLSFDCASLLSCGVLTGWGAVANTARMPPGASAAVVGCGGVGINCLQAAAQTGAMPLVAVDLSAQKLALARQFGATDTVLAGTKTAEEELRAIAPDGFEFVFMAAASGRAVEQSAALLAKTGTLVLAGMPANGDLARIDATALAHGQRRVLGSKMGSSRLRADIPKLIKMHLRGKLKLRELIAGRHALDNINDAVAAAKQGDALRQVIIF